MKRKTAVEWLQELYNSRYEEFLIDDEFEKAKAMEKEQIVIAHNHGEYFSQFREDGLDDIHGVEYYNKTYNK